ncbi:hypothetical protein AB9K32_02740 [Allomuricauda sp. XS_ASV26]|uniref:hypothetical protein n=1 Tax=Flavobacteriaceae TaxID=49546 RepID=UPI001CD3F76D|nr:hypothetical protein [Allomuricauda ruestringensis]MCA0960100.1 hypothetical protein [Allomuricauda ruestringensis]
MKTKVLYILLFAMGVSGAVNAQLNNYKYIIVPKKFEAYKTVNKYQTSTLVKYYFEQNGFDAVYDDALPPDLANERCLGLVADIEDSSSLFATKLNITLKDCNNVEVFRSMEGKSRIKEFNESYKDAIQKAFVSFSGMNYSYVPKTKVKVQDEAPVTISFKDDVKTVEEEPAKYVVEQKSTMDEQVYKAIEPKPSNITRAVVEKTELPDPSSVLYAQAIGNGYQLVDSSPKVVLKLEETSMDNVFMTSYNGNNALVFKKNDKWILEYSDNGEKIQKELNIKF